MFDARRFVRYDAERTLMLTVGPLSRSQALSELPAEFVISDSRLAERFGVEAMPAEVMNARAQEFAALEDGTVWRLWRNPIPTTDGRSVFLSSFDGLPDTGDAPDWGLVSAGYAVADADTLCEWARTVYGSDETAFLETLSRFLSVDLLRMDRAVELIDMVSGAVLNRWPILHDNPLRALRAAAESYPEVRFCEEDFVFSMKTDE